MSPLVTQLSWTNHLLIMSGCKSDEEREFYIRLAIKERYTKRQLERQMDSGYYERYMLSKDKILPEKVQAELNPFLDSYVIEFLDLPTGFLEKDLRKDLISGMKQFMLEIGKNFTYIDEEYAITVGGEDFRIDLLFYHRTLRCLVATDIELMWNAIDTLCDLFEKTALYIEEKSGFSYNGTEAANYRLFLDKVRHLPKSNVSNIL